MEHEEHTFAFLHSNVKGLIIQNIMIPVSSKSYFFKKKKGGGLGLKKKLIRPKILTAVQIISLFYCPSIN